MLAARTTFDVESANDISGRGVCAHKRGPKSELATLPSFLYCMLQWGFFAILSLSLYFVLFANVESWLSVQISVNQIGLWR